MKFLLHKILHWEYWPQWLVYAPIMPVYIYYAIKARTPYFMVAANPSMENGGYIMESKFTIHKQLPQHLVPQTILIELNSSFADVKKQVHAVGIKYPFFCKPDIGGKGRGVMKVENEMQLQQYHNNSCINYLVQAAIPYKNEIGVFYCRMPGAAKGFISGIVSKTVMQVKGDGIKTLKELIEAVPRYYFQRKFLFEQYKEQLNDVLPEGKFFSLSEIGNHARGSLFNNDSNYNNEKLQLVFDTLSDAYNTFYFGRYDIKFNSWQQLYEGNEFMIIELNGSGSEPTHIYDPAMKLWQAWKIIVQHWKIMYQIAVTHHKNGVPYLSFKQGRKLQQAERRLAERFKLHEKRNKKIKPDWPLSSKQIKPQPMVIQ